MNILEDNSNFTLSDDINGPVLSAFIALIMVAAFVANLFVIIVTFCHPKSLTKSSTIFLTSLLLADLVAVIFVMPFGVISAASGSWIFGQSVEVKNGVCQFVGYMFCYNAALVTMTLAVISFDRFLSIVRPFFHERYMKKRYGTAVIIVVIVWIMSAVICSTPLYGLGKFVYAPESSTCVPEFEGQIGFLIYGLVIGVALIGCIVITSVWTCCYASLFLKNSKKRCSINQQKRIFGIFGALLLANAVCFLPITVVAVLAIGVSLPDAAYAVITVCFLFITLTNPLVQSCFRPDVRDTILCKKKKYDNNLS